MNTFFLFKMHLFFILNTISKRRRILNMSFLSVFFLGIKVKGWKWKTTSVAIFTEESIVLRSEQRITVVKFVFFVMKLEGWT